MYGDNITEGKRRHGKPPAGQGYGLYRDLPEQREGRDGDGSVYRKRRLWRHPEKDVQDQRL